MKQKAVKKKQARKQKTKAQNYWGFDLPAWDNDIPAWDKDLPSFDLDLPSFDLDLPQIETKKASKDKTLNKKSMNQRNSKAKKPKKHK